MFYEYKGIISLIIYIALYINGFIQNIKCQNNERHFGLESEQGFLFGSIDSHVSFIRQFRFAHTYSYQRLSSEGHFHINVKNMPGVFWSILSDDTLGYRYLSDNIPQGDGVVLMDDHDKSISTEDALCTFRIAKVPDSDDIFIMHDELCLTYNSSRKKFEKQPCDEYALEQRFIPISVKDGSRIVDAFPLFSSEPEKKLIVE